MAKVDAPGTYRGEIVEHSLGVTSKSGYPQFICRLQVREKFVDNLNELNHFVEQGAIKSAEPQWVDWSSFNEQIVAFLVLFKSAEEFSEESKLLNYDQLQTAIKWEGDEFASLNDDSHIGKLVLFRVEENEYNGEVRLQVNWIDDHEASPTRELGKLDEDTVKTLSSKLKVKKKAKAAKPAKPEKAETPSAPPPKAPSKKAKPVEEAVAEEVAEEAAPRPKTAEKGEAWDYVCNNKGECSDADIEDAWIGACNEVGEDKDEDQFTGEDWAQVREIVIRDLALDL